MVLAVLACTIAEAHGAQRRQLRQVSSGADAAATSQGTGGVNGYDSAYNYGYNAYYDYLECYSVYQLLNNTEGLSFITDALYAVGLAETFDDPFLSATLFAPTDDAFDAAAAALNLTSDELLNSPLLLPIVLYHVLAAPVLAEQLPDGATITTLLEQNLTASVSTAIVAQSINAVVAEANITLNATESTADIVGADNLACAAVIHVIDNVLIPQILSVNVTGDEVSILIGNGEGKVQRFLIVYDSEVTEVTISAAPAPAPSMGLPTSVAQAPTTLAPSGSLTASPSGQKTTAGTTYYTNADLTS
jgi:uncharacterized surface protein with fasciclin (FAS1) repeats